MLDTTPDVDRIVELRNQRWTLSQIAKEVGSNPNAVRAHLRRRGMNVLVREGDMRNFESEIADMTPEDAVQHLLEALEVIQTFEYQPLDHWSKILTHSEATIMSRLEENAPRVVTKAQLYGAVYDLRAEDEWAEPKIVDVFICNIRKKLPPGYTIHTAWGQGYWLEVDPSKWHDPQNASTLQTAPSN